LQKEEDNMKYVFAVLVTFPLIGGANIAVAQTACTSSCSYTLEASENTQSPDKVGKRAAAGSTGREQIGAYDYQVTGK